MRYLTFLAGAEGLGLRYRYSQLVACVSLVHTRPSARGFGVDVGGRFGEQGMGGAVLVQERDSYGLCN